MRVFLGSLIREARTKAEMTLRQMAAQVGCTPSFLSEIETGLRPAPKEQTTLHKIATVLNLPFEEVEKAAQNDHSRRDIKFVKELFARDDELAACYCRAKETCNEDELKKLFFEVFQRAVTHNKET